MATAGDANATPALASGDSIASGSKSAPKAKKPPKAKTPGGRGGRGGKRGRGGAGAEKKVITPLYGYHLAVALSSCSRC